MGQMLSFSPAFVPGAETLVDAGLDPQTFLPVPALGRTLGEARVATYAVKDYRLGRGEVPFCW